MTAPHEHEPDPQQHEPDPHEHEPDPHEGRPAPGHDGEAMTDDDATYPTSRPESGPDVEPGVGGYDERDPATDMPRTPSAPETQGEDE